MQSTNNRYQVLEMFVVSGCVILEGCSGLLGMVCLW